MEIKIKKPNIHETWYEVLKEEFQQPYFLDLKKKLLEEKKRYTIFPPSDEIFQAYNLTPFDKVKVVIIGQDPYHGPGQAHGLCFSVKKGVKPPPSLVNIFKELHDDLGMPEPNHGDLTDWAKQGVFLLNAILTVRSHQPASHHGIGWERFTDETIKALSAKKNHLVFLLWGNFAKQKANLIDKNKHLILTAAHPSPFSAKGFFGCKHFSKTNQYLRQHNIEPIDWNLSKS